MNTNQCEKAKIIAFYLPQFYPFKENDAWWGKGYTEWTSVARTRKLFPGHEQPKLPGELGFYDLRLHATRTAQAELAKKYGVDGFCYYYYRLAKGSNLMDEVLKDILQSGTPNLPFMLCWANHSWLAKNWNRHDKSKTSKVLIKQEYGDEEDIKDYFYELLPYFQDPRYIKEDNCPLFAIYQVLDIPNIQNYLKIWNELAIQHGFNGIKIFAYTEESKFEEKKLLSLGFDKIISCRKNACFHNHNQLWRYTTAIIRKIFRLPKIQLYKNVIKEMVAEETYNEHIIPTIMPNWDHSPRSGRYCYMWIKSTPVLFKEHVKMILERIKNKQNKWVFIKSWNEWGEGNYLEPDRKWQDAYLKALSEARKEFKL